MLQHSISSSFLSNTVFTVRLLKLNLVADTCGIRWIILSNSAVLWGDFEKDEGIPDKLLKKTLALLIFDVAFSINKFSQLMCVTM